jgi:hypothetical protein
MEKILRENIIEAANKSMMQMNSWEPLDYYLQNLSATGTTEEFLTSEPLKTGYIYVINFMGAYEEGTQVSNNISLGYIAGGFFHILEKSKPGEDLMASFTGQIILKEGDRLKCSFKNTTATDKLYFFANGYKIPMLHTLGLE